MLVFYKAKCSALHHPMHKTVVWSYSYTVVIMTSIVENYTVVEWKSNDCIYYSKHETIIKIMFITKIYKYYYTNSKSKIFRSIMILYIWSKIPSSFVYGRKTINYVFVEFLRHNEELNSFLLEGKNIEEKR